jgi:hypothetical protein
MMGGGGSKLVGIILPDAEGVGYVNSVASHVLKRFHNGRISASPISISRHSEHYNVIGTTFG